MERNDNDLKGTSNKVRLQSAISDIINGYLFLNEAVEKYEIPASTIIQHLKKIQEEKEKTSQQNNAKMQNKEINDSRNKDEN